MALFLQSTLLTVPISIRTLALLLTALDQVGLSLSVWMCTVSISDTKNKKETNSNYSVVPNVTISASSTAPLIEGRDTLELDCDVDANPPPSITWYKDVQKGSENTVQSLQEIGTGREFTIDTVSRHDAGTYTCIATNLIGESAKKDIFIDVQCKFQTF